MTDQTPEEIREIEIQDIVHRSVDQAEQLIPRKAYKWFTRIGIGLASFLIVTAAVLSGVNTSLLAQERACLKANNLQINQIRNENSKANTANAEANKAWINSLTDLIDGKTKPLPTPVAAFNAITAAYNKQLDKNNQTIAAGNAAITKLQNKNCA